jgi:hypothetical protein
MKLLIVQGTSSDEEVAWGASASCTISMILSTGLPITSLLDKPEKIENALFACTTKNGGVDKTISLYTKHKGRSVSQGVLLGTK